MNRLSCVVLFAVLSFASISKSDDAKAKAKSFDGTWIPASAELGGEKFPEQIRATIKLVVDGEKYTVTVGNVVDLGTVKRDESKTPMTMDITGTEGPNKGKTILAIYELADDKLKVCYDLTGKARPSEFKSNKGTQEFLVTYEKMKK